MITCAIESDEYIIDNHLENDALRFIEDLAKKDKEIRFLCCRDPHGYDFTSIILETIHKYQKENPDHKTTILYVTNDDEVSNWNGKYIYTGAIAAPKPKKELTAFLAEKKHNARWLISQSEYLLCYYYEIANLYKPPQTIKTAAKRNDLTIMNLKRDSTELKLHELTHLLDQRQRYIIEAYKEKKKVSEMADYLGISKVRVMQIYNYATRILCKSFINQNGETTDS